MMKRHIFMKNKLDINEYFSDKEILKILCRKRAVEAKKGHDQHFLRNISAKTFSPHTNVKKEIFSFFPPRNSWIRLNKKERDIRDTNAVEVNAIQLERTVSREIKRYRTSNKFKPDWLKKLESFFAEIRFDVFNDVLSYEVGSPKIIPVLKDKKENTYRPICVFK